MSQENMRDAPFSRVIVTKGSNTSHDKFWLLYLITIYAKHLASSPVYLIGSVL
jgi:hypothetical protein